jgi:hypothetical protein
MSSIGLLTPILNGGIQNVNFVSGRVLTASDLTAERTANLQRQRLLGTCVGSGVANGLEVTLSASSVPYGQQVVHVTAGLAVNLNGDLLQLPNDTDVTLTAPTQTTAANAGLFAVCEPPRTQLTNPGIYVLTIMPASGYQGQVPVTQLNSGGVGTSCTSQYATAGVQFRLVQITLTSSGSGLQPTLYLLANQIQSELNNNASAASVASALSQLQNGLAYACFGIEQLEAYPATPFEFVSQTASYGLIDQARNLGLLTACEIPIALLFWTPAGVQFLDLWSVRRRLTQSAITPHWPLLEGDRRRSEAEAMLLQFEDHVQSLLSSSTNISSVAVDSYFLYLPPAGILPVTSDGISIVTGTPSTNAFDMPTFFAAHASKDIATTDGDLVREIFTTALDYEPMLLAQTGEMQLYVIWENVQYVNSNANAQLALVFASPAMRYQGVARFVPSTDIAGGGTARWSLSRFAPHVI